MKSTASTTNTFLYDGWNLIHEEMEAATPTSRSYVWGLDLSGTLQGAGGVGGLLARVREENIPRPLYYAGDANGNVTDLVDTNGAVVAHYEYDPYGNTIAQSGAQADANPFRFSSKYWDGETGFYYYGYRYYSPGMGRWLNRDPLSEQTIKEITKNSLQFDRLTTESPSEKQIIDARLTKQLILANAYSKLAMAGESDYGFVGNRPINKCDYLGMIGICDYNPCVFVERYAHGLWCKYDCTLKRIYGNCWCSDCDQQFCYYRSGALLVGGPPPWVFDCPSETPGPPKGCF